MSQEPFSGPSLFEKSESVRDLKEVHLREYAGMASLIDWELAKFLDRLGMSLARLSFTFKDDEVLLVVKIREGDLPYVVFVSRTSPMGCVRTFVRKLEEGTLAKYPDRFG